MTTIPTVDREAERAVIGACLMAPDIIDDVSAITRPAEFHDPLLEEVFTALLGMRAQQDAIDYLTVAARMGDSLLRRGGIPVLADLVQSAPVWANAPHYAQTVHDAALLRKVGEVGTRLGQMAQATPDTTDAVLDYVNAARAELDELATGQSESTHEQDVYAATEALDSDVPFLPTPWKALTEALGGWRPGCLYYVGARPGVGKSVFGVGAAVDVARRHKHAHIATLEMSKVELYHRMLSAAGSVDQERMTRRFLGKPEWESLAKAASDVASLPLSVDDRATQRVSDIRAKARAIARTTDLGIVVVDYLQLMRSSGRAESRQTEVAEFSRSLKLLAKELQVPVIALSQLNRQSEARHDRMPGLADLRESGALEQDGDAVLLLHRETDPERGDPDELTVLVAKHRHGPADLKVRLQWEGRFSRLGDRVHVPAAPEASHPGWYESRERD